MRCQLAIGALAAALLAGACATSCPVGSIKHGGAPPNGAAQWCQRAGPANDERKVAATNEVLGAYRPHTQGRLLVGPYADWHANGHLRAHGAFELRGGISEATGIWTFFGADGKRAVEGRYVWGYPVGCFAVWTDERVRLTLQARGGHLAKARCTPPQSAEASRLAEKYRRAKLGQIVPELFSVAVGFVRSPNSIPVDAATLMQPDAATRTGVRIELRRQLARFKLGVTSSVILTDEVRSWIASAAALGSLSLLPNSSRFDVELSSELGARMYSVWPRISVDRAAGTSERFITPYAGVQVAAGYHLTEYLSVYAALLGQHDLPMSAKRLSRYCDPFACVGMETNWDIGGGFVGAMLQLRIIVR